MTSRRTFVAAPYGFAAIALGLHLVSGVSTAQPSGPVVIGHRGASGYLPEHTLPAYALAHGQGADYIEPDLVRTRDGVFVCLHDVYLDATTDVATVYPERARADGRWYAADFTLEEVRRLRAHERLLSRFPRGRSRFTVPTFEEMIELVAGLNRTTGRRAGIYPELKAPAWHREQGLAMEEPFLEILRRHRAGSPELPVYVQSFEPEPLIELRRLGSPLPQVFLVADSETDPPRLDDAALERIAEFADGIGPAKTLVERDPGLVERAHRRGLVVHPYTFRADDVPAGYASFEEELASFLGKLRVDGIFTDFPDRARRWLDGSTAGASR
ncbi:MAG TPA: glycerophosphodiester phosphodiesterase family protein [Thermoanaerobaculia bacterium]|nr:glycerophosphodiester phosphodiesterase family protein [Thermoanaerobaculia bacterium]